MLLTAVHVDDNEVTNDSVISHVSSRGAPIIGQLSASLPVLPIYDRTIVTSQSLEYDFYSMKMCPEINSR